MFVHKLGSKKLNRIELELIMTLEIKKGQTIFCEKYLVRVNCKCLSKSANNLSLNLLNCITNMTPTFQTIIFSKSHPSWFELRIFDQN